MELIAWMESIVKDMDELERNPDRVRREYGTLYGLFE